VIDHSEITSGQNLKNLIYTGKLFLIGNLKDILENYKIVKKPDNRSKSLSERNQIL